MKGIFCWRRICCSILLLSCVGVTNASQRMFDCLFFKPYVGLEYQYEHIKAHGDYHLLLPANFQYGSLFLGAKWHKNFGAEIAYYRSLKTSQNQFQYYNWGGSTVSGITSTIARTSFKGFSADLDIYYPLDPEFNIYAVLGLVTMHETLTVSATGSSDLAPALSLLSGKNTTVPRVGAGVEYIWRHHWGLRSRMLWVYTQNIKLNVAAAQAEDPSHYIYPKAYLQAVEATVGVFYIF
jgi:hypothetical protein